VALTLPPNPVSGLEFFDVDLIQAWLCSVLSKDRASQLFGPLSVSRAKWSFLYPSLFLRPPLLRFQGQDYPSNSFTCSHNDFSVSDPVIVGVALCCTPREGISPSCGAVITGVVSYSGEINMTVSERISSIIKIPGDNDFMGLSCFLGVGLPPA